MAEPQVKDEPDRLTDKEMSQLVDGLTAKTVLVVAAAGGAHDRMWRREDGGWSVVGE